MDKGAASREPPCPRVGSIPRGGTCALAGSLQGPVPRRAKAFTGRIMPPALTRKGSFEKGGESPSPNATRPSSRSSSAARRNLTGKTRAFAVRTGKVVGHKIEKGLSETTTPPTSDPGKAVHGAEEPLRRHRPGEADVEALRASGAGSGRPEVIPSLQPNGKGTREAVTCIRAPRFACRGGGNAHVSPEEARAGKRDEGRTAARYGCSRWYVPPGALL